MKICRPKKWLTCLRVITLVGIVFFISTSTLDKTYITVTKNENLNKAVSYDLITDQQTESYNMALYEPISSFTGELTGYAGDCPLCTGVVACKPRINVLEKGIFFDDEEYGTIRMVASSKRYPCGTILRFNVNRISNEPVIAVVLDRGVGGNDIDLLMENETEARKNVGRVRNLEFEVLRLGWE